MPALNEISGIGAPSLELLEVVGILDAEHLAAQNPDFLVAELRRANEALSIAKKSPGKATVTNWISSAIDLVGAQPSAPVRAPDTPVDKVAGAVNYEASPEAREMLDQAPYAIPLPGRVMMAGQLRVTDVPAGLLLNRYSGDLDVRVGDPSAPRTDVPSRRNSRRAEPSPTHTQQRQFDASKVKAISDSAPAAPRVPQSKEGHEEDRVALIRAPREKTNRGKDPNSRRYIRGVLHTHPWSLRIGAVASLLLVINLPLAIVSGFLLLLSQENPDDFSWVPPWILAFPTALPITGLMYLIWGMTGKCRICTQKLFVHKGALKHVKAHRLPGMGYVVPLCLHLLLFSWFRCSSCGTPVRLKK